MQCAIKVCLTTQCKTLTTSVFPASYGGTHMKKVLTIQMSRLFSKSAPPSVGTLLFGKIVLPQQTARQFSRSAVFNRDVFTVSDSETFMNKVLNNDFPVIVNFHAEWCDPCKILTPKLEELVIPLPGVDLAVIDVETCPDLVHAFEVKAVPAVIAVRSGLVVDKFVGLVDAGVIEEFIKRLSRQTMHNNMVENAEKKLEESSNSGQPVKDV